MGSEVKREKALSPRGRGESFRVNVERHALHVRAACTACAPVLFNIPAVSKCRQEASV